MFRLILASPNVARRLSSRCRLLAAVLVACPTAGSLLAQEELPLPNPPAPAATAPSSGPLLIGPGDSIQRNAGEIGAKIGENLRQFREEAGIAPPPAPAQVSAGKATIGVRFRVAEPGESSSPLAIARVLPDSPALRAGVIVGDEITAIDGRRVQSPADVTDYLAQRIPDETIVLTIRRGSREHQFDVKLGDPTAASTTQSVVRRSTVAPTQRDVAVRRAEYRDRSSDLRDDPRDDRSTAAAPAPRVNRYEYDRNVRYNDAPVERRLTLRERIARRRGTLRNRFANESPDAIAERVARFGGAVQNLGSRLSSDLGPTLGLGGGSVAEGPAVLGVNFDDRGPGAVWISAVTPGSPAEAAGLRSGDLILLLDGRQVDSAAQFKRQIAELRPGDTVRIDVRRGAEEFQLAARLARHADVYPSQGDYRR